MHRAVSDGLPIASPEPRSIPSTSPAILLLTSYLWRGWSWKMLSKSHLNDPEKPFVYLCQ